MTATAEDVIAAAGSPQEARRAAFGVMWRLGDLSYHLSEIQKRARALVYEHPGRRVVLETNRRFGKSRTCTTVAGETAQRFPGIRIPYFAPTGDQCETFVHPHMLTLSEHAPPDIAPELVGGDWRFPPLQWHNEAGNPVPTYLHGGAEVSRFRGPKVAEQLRMSTVATVGCETRRSANHGRGTGTVLVIIDECRDIEIIEYVLRQVAGPMLWEARSRWHDLVRACLLIASTTADNLEHAFNGIADAAQETGAYLHATVYDCDHLSDQDIADAIEEAGGEDTVAWQIEGLARRTRDPRIAVFPEFDRARHVAAVERPSHFLPCVIGDGGFIDQAFYGFGFYDFEHARYVVEDELVFRRERSDAQDRAIAAREAELWPGVDVERRRVDSPPQVRADMNRAEWGREWGTEADGPQPPHWLSVSKPRSRRAGSMESGVNRVRKLLAEGRLVIHPRCTTLIAHAEGARWNTQRDSFVRVVDDDGEPLHHYDGAASLVYFARDCNAHDNPIPQVPAGVGLPTHIIRKHLLRKTEDDKIRGLFGRKAGGR